MTTGPDFSQATWRKSSRTGSNSGGGGAQCVEMAFVPGAVGVRDSKNPAGPVLAFDRDQFASFIGATKIGKFDQG